MITKTDRYRQLISNRIFHLPILFLCIVSFVTTVSAIPLTVTNPGWTGSGSPGQDTSFVFYISSDTGANVTLDNPSFTWVKLSDTYVPAGLNIPVTVFIHIPTDLPGGVITQKIYVTEVGGRDVGQVTLRDRISIPVRLDVKTLLGKIPITGNVTPTPTPVTLATEVINASAAKPITTPLIAQTKAPTVAETQAPTTPRPTLAEDNPSGAVAGWFARGENASMIFVIAFFGCVGLWYIMKMRRDDD
jgi:hypothetical protein